LGLKVDSLASAQAPVSAILLILLGALALVVILRAIWVFALAFLGVRSALDNEGFAARFWNARKTSRGKKTRHHPPHEH